MPPGSSKNAALWTQRVREVDLREENMRSSLFVADSEAKNPSETNMRKKGDLENE